MKLGDIPNIINDALRVLTAWLCEFIYPGIAGLYQLFKDIGTLAYSDNFSAIYNKISLIIGIFMVFRVTFWLIETLVNPDYTNDKEKNPGKIVQKVLVAVVLLATTPAIFEYAFKLQKVVIESNFIEEIISPSGSVIDSTESGRYMAAELFTNFYTVNIDENGQYDTGCKLVSEFLYDDLINDGTMKNLSGPCVTKRFQNDPSKGYVIDFNGLFALGVGGFVFWMVLMYCISLGARYVQLIYLQIIAPIPIMCYLAPGKDNMFSKWIKQCTTTYLDLFIRVAIINFVMLLSNMILANDNNVILDMANSSQSGWLKVFLVLGLLMFAKKAPELIQELLPKSVTKASGDFGLSWKKRTDNMLGGKMIYGATSKVARGATYGAIGGLATGVVGFAGGRGTGRITGMIGGMARGISAGSKSGAPMKNFTSGIKKQTEVNKRKIDWANNDSSFGGRTAQRMANTFGFEGAAERFENQISGIDSKIEENKTKIAQKKRQSVAYKDISSTKSSIESRAESKLLNETYDIGEKPIRYNLQKQLLEAKAKLEYVQQTGGSPDEIVAAQMNYNSTLKEVKEAYITSVIEGKIGDGAMSSMLEHIKHVVENNKTDGTFDGLSADFKEYKDLDDFESETTKKNNEITEGPEGINQVETQIKSLEDEKAGIQSTEEYKKAIADRNAVGGHSGKK